MPISGFISGSGTSLAVRLAEEPDFRPMAELMGELLDSEGPVAANLKTQISALSWLTSQPSSGRALCATLDEELVGVCTNHYTISTALSELVCRIEDVVVSTSRRRQGIGKYLVLSAIEQAKKDGCGKIYLHVGKSNMAAQSLYYKLGFKKDEMEIMSYYID